MPYRDGSGPYGTGPVGWGMGPCGKGVNRGRFGRRNFWACRPEYADPAKTDDKEFLKKEKEILKNEIETIEKRLKELEREK